MLAYATTDQCLMAYLRAQLDDPDLDPLWPLRQLHRPAPLAAGVAGAGRRGWGGSWPARTWS